jgi:hypothetical protein
MFDVTFFSNLNLATEHIKKFLAELESTEAIEYQVIHAISETECDEDGGNWDKTSSLILPYLRNLDAQQGYMVCDKEFNWYFLEWEEPDNISNIFNKKRDDLYVSAGEGVVVLCNKFALCDGQFPIVVLKPTFWKENDYDIIHLLKTHKAGTDYTAKINPAVYVELYYSETI